MSKTLLLADDSVTIQKVVGISFASEDMALVAVGNGDDALARAKEIHPDVILADVVMPGKNGYEVCEAVKADPDLRHIPVLLLTGTFEAFDEARAQQVGAAGYIAKPFESRALVDQVNRLFVTGTEPTETPSTTPSNDSLDAADSSDPSFEFFDDPLAEIDPSAAGATEIDGDLQDLAFDESDSSPALTFGDADLDPLEFTAEPVLAPPAMADEPAPSPTSDAQAVEVTPDAAPPQAVDITSTESENSPPEGVDPFWIEGSDPDEPLVPLENLGASDPSFDFTANVGPGNLENLSHSLQDNDTPARVEPDDLAEATLLDPNGASGYDVSASDLSPPPAIDEIESPVDGENSISQSDQPAETVLAAEFADLDASTPPDTERIDAEPVALDQNEFLAAPEFASEPQAVDAEEDSGHPAPAPEIQPEPERAERALPPEATAQTESILERIEPQLRDQLHDSLEKIAWESFGDLTETIVRQAVERVEAIAWEVIPQMAEALISEEIRRMKGSEPGEDS